MDYAAIVKPEEMALAGQWQRRLLAVLHGEPLEAAGAPVTPCFSFLYGGRPSAELLGRWLLAQEDLTPAEGATGQRLTWSDPASGLQVVLEIKAYAHFPVIEWVVWFRNTRPADTPILSAIQALDVSFPLEGLPVLHYNQGDVCGPASFEPKQLPLEYGAKYGFAPIGGRPTSFAFPYFNLQREDGQEGVIIAVGWPGQWAAWFARDEGGRVSVQAGQELTHLKLLPGEEIRTPLAVLLFWQGDVLRAQNLWRRWMLAHNVPRPGGELPPPISAMCAGLHQNEEGEKGYIDQLVRHGARLDYWWMDAGWYPSRKGWHEVGTWEPDPERFPGGIRAVSEHAHANGMKLVLWFELERVSPGSAWWGHEAWLLTLPAEQRRYRWGRAAVGGPQFTVDEAHRNQIVDGDRLFNLGHPQAWQFLTDYVSRCISEWGIDIFRLDHNIAPLLFWRAADAPDRQGSTENHYVRGLLAFFDELRRRHPTLLIDSCASGGRRIDLETMRRAVVYTRSDYWCTDSDADQCQTYGLSSWIPHFMTACPRFRDTYRFRSNLSPCLGMDFDLAGMDEEDWALYRQRLLEWRRLAPYFYGDYYPLTPWSRSNIVIDYDHADNRVHVAPSANPAFWLAWQFDRPDLGEGLVQVFRRADSPFESARLRLRGLEPGAVYRIINLDAPDRPVEMAGQELLTVGLPVTVPEARQAVVFLYQAR